MAVLFTFRFVICLELVSGCGVSGNHVWLFHMDVHLSQNQMSKTVFHALWPLCGHKLVLTYGHGVVSGSALWVSTVLAPCCFNTVASAFK